MKFICSYPNLFVCILIYFNKTYIFIEFLKNVRIIIYIFFKIQALLIYELANKNNLKNINDQNFEHFVRGYDKGFYGSRIIFNSHLIIILFCVSTQNTSLSWTWLN